MPTKGTSWADPILPCYAAKPQSPVQPHCSGPGSYPVLNIKALVAGRGDRRTVLLPGEPLGMFQQPGIGWEQAQAAISTALSAVYRQRRQESSRQEGARRPPQGPPGRGTGTGREWLLNGKE